MSSGERPIGGAKGTQPNTEASCQPPPPSGRLHASGILPFSPLRGSSMWTGGYAHRHSPGPRSAALGWQPVPTALFVSTGTLCIILCNGLVQPTEKVRPPPVSLPLGPPWAKGYAREKPPDG